MSAEYFTDPKWNYLLPDDDETTPLEDTPTTNCQMLRMKKRNENAVGWDLLTPTKATIYPGKFLQIPMQMTLCIPKTPSYYVHSTAFHSSDLRRRQSVSQSVSQLVSRQSCSAS